MPVQGSPLLISNLEPFLQVDRLPGNHVPSLLIHVYRDVSSSCLQLAVRQAELGEHGRARQEYLAEATQLAKQLRALASQTEVTLGELREGMCEALKVRYSATSLQI